MVPSGHASVRAASSWAAPDLFIPRLIELYKQGRFSFDRLLKTYKLDGINQAVEDLKNWTIIKAVLHP